MHLELTAETAALDRMKAVIVLLVPLLLPLVSAQTFRWGPCPTPMVQPNFELNKVGLCKYIEFKDDQPPKLSLFTHTNVFLNPNAVILFGLEWHEGEKIIIFGVSMPLIVYSELI